MKIQVLPRFMLDFCFRKAVFENDLMLSEVTFSDVVVLSRASKRKVWRSAPSVFVRKGIRNFKCYVAPA